MAPTTSPEAPDREPAQGRPAAGLATQLGRFATIGVASTVLHLGMFAAVTGALGALSANLVALLVATVLNTAANRAWTFEVRGRQDALRHQLQGLAVFAVTWGLTSLALLGLQTAAPGAPAGVQTAVVAVANVVSTLVRFVALRRWMAAPDRGASDVEASTVERHPELEPLA